MDRSQPLPNPKGGDGARRGAMQASLARHVDGAGTGPREHAARMEASKSQSRRTRIAVDLDLAKFFDMVQHDVLMARVARTVRDKRLLALIERYLRAGVLVGETIHASDIGTPQGGPLSPLLANILFG